MRRAGDSPCKKTLATEMLTKRTYEIQALGQQPGAEAQMPYMTSRDESRKEVSASKPSLATPKQKVRIAAWNVRTMFETGKTAQVTNEMKKYNISILGISEARWNDSGKLTLNSGETICYSGRSDGIHQEGVAIIMDNHATKCLLEWEPINSRIIRARFNSRFIKTTIIQCYAPTEQAAEEDKEAFYVCLQQQIDKTPRHDILLVMGDLNAKVGSNNEGYEECMGQQGMGTQNDNGTRFADLCRENGMVIGGTIFHHKAIHKLTWTSPDGKTRNQIDHLAINQKWRRSLTDVKVIRGADAGSDHFLLLGVLNLKLKKQTSKATDRQFDSQRLKDPDVRHNFTLELKNKFSILNAIPVDDLDEKNEMIQKAFVETSQVVLGHRKKQRKAWISDTTWDLIEERKTTKKQLLACKSHESREQLSQEYKAKNSEVKKSSRRDKRTYIDNLAKEAQEAADKGDTRTVYKITKSLTGGFTNTSTIVKDKNGNTLTKEEDQLDRWAEHFQEVLNRGDPDEEIDIDLNHPHAEIEMCRGRITKGEIELAIKQCKANKAPGEDRITADMLKADSSLSAEILEQTFNQVWNEEKVPDTWKKGIIVKLPKKGDLSLCGNWRGINLLSVPGKIFCRVLLQRIKQGIDKQLREEQAGFRSGRSCNDQIFVLRTIVEQSIEWNSSLYINYIDFEKAFDSVHHPSLWKILELYGFPTKVINIIKDMYEDNRCCVRHDGKHSDWFQVKTGVRQGCIISPLLFLVVIDWVMKKATSDKPRGITWNVFNHLEDCDFADDIGLISPTYNKIQEKTDRVDKVARSVGLKIHPSKSKLMRVKTKSQQAVTVRGESLEDVSDFKYLGSIISADGNIEREISARIGQAAYAFRKLNNIWKSTFIHTKTKLKIYKSNVRSILLYASETWRTNKKIESKLRGFEGRCLRRILHIWWEQRVTNKEMWERAGMNNIVLEVKKRRWRWLGHVLRMKKERHPHAVLTWAPPGKRKRGRPLGTWRRTVEEEMSDVGKTWYELRWLAMDRAGWRDFVNTLCSTGSEED